MFFLSRFLWVDSKAVNAKETLLKSRYELAKTIPDTRKHHYFKPLNHYSVEIKEVSYDTLSKIVDFRKKN